MKQLVLELPQRTALGRDDFLVTASNAAAVAMIDQWPHWPAPAIVLLGPPGSGKSHLVEVWRQRSGAAKAGIAELREEAVPGLLSSGALALEDAPGEGLDETALFHLLNYARQQASGLLITTNQNPVGWRVNLADLRSRLRALPVAELGAPDDSLLRGVLVKLFADRQISVEESVISYLVVRMPRSLDAARLVVAEIDRKAMEDKAEVSRPFVARILARLHAPGLFAEES